MNYVKIGLEEYERLKKSHDALRAKKVLSVSYTGMFAWNTRVQDYYTESEVIAELTKRVNELEGTNNELRAELNKPKVEVKSKSFWDFLKNI